MNNLLNPKINDLQDKEKEIYFCNKSSTNYISGVIKINYLLYKYYKIATFQIRDSIYLVCLIQYLAN